ncbi:MAG: hypothetical protein HXX20_21685 [Chloroflexi bacterium]|nr:hypothetical protein [Chloroflexota bacterium]
MNYRVQSLDTSYEAEQIQIGLFRKKGEVGRGELMLSLTRTTRWLSWNSFLKLHPDITRQEAALTFLELTYSKELSEMVRDDLLRRVRLGQPFKEDKLLILEEMLLALTPVIELLEELGVTYLIGGSVASSTHGIARATANADLVADLKPEHIAPRFQLS